MKERISKELKKEFFERFAVLITGAFTFVAGLAWNDAIQNLIKTYISPGNSVVSQLIYAVIITIVAIIAIYQVNNVAKRYKGVDEKCE